MPNPDLQNYITQSRQQGMTDDQIRKNLVGQGWKQEDVDSVLGKKHTILLLFSYFYLILGLLMGLFVIYQLISFNDPNLDPDSLGWGMLIVSGIFGIYGFIGLIFIYSAKSLKLYKVFRTVSLIIYWIFISSFIWIEALYNIFI